MYISCDFVLYSDPRFVKVQQSPANQQENNQGSPPLTPEESQNQLPIDQIDISEWKIYQNKKYGFTFRYPFNYLIESDSPDGEEDHQSLSVALSSPKEYGYGENLTITILYNTPTYTHTPGSRLESEVYNRNENRWFLGDTPTCLEAVPLGAQGIPSYQFDDGDAGQFSRTNVVITTDAFIELKVWNRPFGGNDPNLQKIIESFSLDSAGLSIKAQCNS
jgi:hypothetical protein